MICDVTHCIQVMNIVSTVSMYKNTRTQSLLPICDMFWLGYTIYTELEPARHHSDEIQSVTHYLCGWILTKIPNNWKIWRIPTSTIHFHDLIVILFCFVWFNLVLLLILADFLCPFFLFLMETAQFTRHRKSFNEK